MDFRQLRPFFESAGIPAAGCCRWDPAFIRPDSHLKNRLPDGAASILCALFPYYTKALEHPDRNLSRYACVPDYHVVVGQYLTRVTEALSAAYPRQAFQPFCDASPLYEREVAVQAGLGVRGEHGLLIHPVFGSYCFIGTIVTTLSVTPTAPSGRDTCRRCGRCRRLSGTGADVRGIFAAPVPFLPDPAKGRSHGGGGCSRHQRNARVGL